MNKTTQSQVWDTMKEFGLPNFCIEKLLKKGNCNTSVGYFEVNKVGEILYKDLDGKVSILNK